MFPPYRRIIRLFMLCFVAITAVQRYPAPCCQRKVEVKIHQKLELATVRQRSNLFLREESNLAGNPDVWSEEKAQTRDERAGFC